MTPPVNYYYDNASLPSGAPASFNRGYATGRLVAVTYGSSSSNGDYSGYDELGRPIRHVQQTDGVNYLTEATYYLNGAMATETYPSVPGASDRRTVSYSLDSAARLSSLSSSATSYAAAASLSSISYKPHGALESETLGNSLIHQMSYNTRLQTTAVKLGTSGNPTSVLNLTYDYGTTDNNGNVKSHVNTIGSLAITDTFAYDSLNRISSTVETTTSGTGWTENNGYDRYGNRWIDYGGGSHNLSFSTSTNRITTSGYAYDSVGNLTSDGSTNYGYDAENHMISVNSTTGYKYDGEGRRVRKLIGENTRFIYGVGGDLVAEFNGANGNLQKEYVSGGGMMAVIDPSAGTRYTTTDHLGSPRVVTNSSGSVVSRHDYMPFGAEIGSTTSGRSSSIGYGASDGVREQFTGQQRDAESGLDYFGARYYSSAHGRFTSTDPLLASGQTPKPQTWNRYAYVSNNPLRLVDPGGMSEERPGPPSADLRGGGGGAFSAILNQQREWVTTTVTVFVLVVTQETIYTNLPEDTAASAEPQNSSNPQITPCDRKFASTFGDSDAVGRTAYDYNGQYRGLDPAARARAAGLPRTDFSSPVWDAEHLYNFPHLSGNLAGTANADIYVPGNYTGQPTGPTKTDAVVTFYYKNFFGMSNVTLAVFHVANFSPERMADGSVRIGTTGGPGGNTPGPSPNLHAHFELWSGRGYRPPGAGRDAARIPLTPVICK